jgi:CheY-like chemotaxis protein
LDGNPKQLYLICSSLGNGIPLATSGGDVTMQHTPGVRGNRKTILAVDDDPEILASISDIFQEKFNIIQANDGAEALERSKEFNGAIDLLLTDFHMPKLNGIELATEITRRRPKIKVVMISSILNGMLVLGEGWHFLAKPLIESQLRTLVTGILSPTSTFGKPVLPALSGAGRHLG